MMPITQKLHVMNLKENLKATFMPKYLKPARKDFNPLALHKLKWYENGYRQRKIAMAGLFQIIKLNATKQTCVTEKSYNSAHWLCNTHSGLCLSNVAT